MRRCMMMLATRIACRARMLGQAALILGLMSLAADRAEAQYGYAGSYGAYAGYGAGMGMSLGDQWFLRQQIWTLNASQAQLNAAQAEREYWAAILAREQAASMALDNRKLAGELRGPVAIRPRPAKVARRRGHAPAAVARRAALATNHLRP
jgi:hypothetical protein